MHEDLEKQLSREVWELTPLELVTQLAYSGLPAAITVNTAKPGWLKWSYREKAQFLLPISLLHRPDLTVAKLVKSNNFLCPSIYDASQYSHSEK